MVTLAACLLGYLAISIVAALVMTLLFRVNPAGS